MDKNPHVVRLLKLKEVNHSLSLPNKPNILVVVDQSLINEDLEEVTRFFSDRATVKCTSVENINKESEKSSYDVILSGLIGDNSIPCNIDLFSEYLLLLKPGGTLLAKSEPNADQKLLKLFKMCGLINVITNDETPGIIVGNKHLYKTGISDKVSLNSETKDDVISAWKSNDNESETISEDDLLEADDLKKPDSSSLRVCATTKKAKACKDCSCGLAEELEAANKPKDAPKPDTSNAKSSCGSCYLGDAFRCASCPYLGMPAFKPGEKVQLAGNLLQDDF